MRFLATVTSISSCKQRVVPFLVSDQSLDYRLLNAAPHRVWPVCQLLICNWIAAQTQPTVIRYRCHNRHFSISFTPGLPSPWRLKSSNRTWCFFNWSDLRKFTRWSRWISSDWYQHVFRLVTDDKLDAVSEAFSLFCASFFLPTRIDTVYWETVGIAMFYLHSIHLWLTKDRKLSFLYTARGKRFQLLTVKWDFYYT